MGPLKERVKKLDEKYLLNLCCDCGEELFQAGGGLPRVELFELFWNNFINGVDNSESVVCMKRLDSAWIKGWMPLFEMVNNLSKGKEIKLEETVPDFRYILWRCTQDNSFALSEGIIREKLALAIHYSESDKKNLKKARNLVRRAIVETARRYKGISNAKTVSHDEERMKDLAHFIAHTWVVELFSYDQDFILKIMEVIKNLNEKVLAHLFEKLECYLLYIVCNDCCSAIQEVERKYSLPLCIEEFNNEMHKLGKSCEKHCFSNYKKTVGSYLPINHGMSFIH